MPNKSFGIYNSGNDVTVHPGDNLVLEAGKTHIACMLRQHEKLVTAFELFTFNEREATNYSELFAAVVAQSKIIDKVTSPTLVVINNELSLLVPIFKFNKSIATSYLDIVFGEDSLSQTKYEHVAVEPDVMNVFKIGAASYDILNTSLHDPVYHHAYSNILQSLSERSSSLAADFIAIRFYPTYFNVAVYKNSQFQLIQTFVYEIPEDVVYHLLNIKERLALDEDNLVLEVSGMIDLNFNLHNELTKYFKNVVVENVDPALTSLDLQEFPLHYFTPFFNLATCE